MFYALVGAVLIGLSLGLMGSGGSILTVPVLTFLVGQEDKVAIAGSLAIVGAISLFAGVPYARRRDVDFRSVVLFGVPGMGGAYLGAYLSQFVSGAVQLLVFAALMVVAGALMFRPAPTARVEETKPHAPAKVVAEGLIVGVITGFVGVGGGFMIVPALVLLGGLSMRRAIGTSLFIIALKSFAGFAKYVDVLDDLGLQLDWQVIGVVSAVGIGGSFAGSALSARLPQSTLRRGFAVFLFVIATFVVARSAPEVLGSAPTDEGLPRAAPAAPVDG